MGGTTISDTIGSVLVLGGMGLGIVCGTLWARYRWLHAAPFAYAVFLYALNCVVTRSFSFRLTGVLAMGLTFYAMGWLALAQDRWEKKPRTKQGKP